MTRGASVLDRLERRQPIADRVVVVTAHPDDEALGLGGSLGRFSHLTIVQLTDGAIDDPDAWAKAGVTTRAAYRALRHRERDAAWEAAEWTAASMTSAVIDQETVHHLPDLVARVTSWIAGADVVFTHPYEGGHPDHDSAAFAVQQACDALTDVGDLPPDRLEFASYHWDGQRRVVGRFWPPTEIVTGVRIMGDHLARKQRALAQFTSQRSVLRWFEPGIERYRVAPRYDFTQPPPPPACLYDRKAWKTTSAQWRVAAAAAMAPRRGAGMALIHGWITTAVPA